MKKVILCATALMFGAIGFAQVSGAPQASQVAAQAGAAAGANTGESVQNGNDNRVWVRQAGTSQSVYTNQNDGSGMGGNLARVRQTGVVNPLSGELNLAEVLQSGSENQSTTWQQGDRNNAITRQGQNDDASARNKALIQQGNNQNAEDNFAAIDQDGEDNNALTFQTWDNSAALTTQLGNENTSFIRQKAGPNGTDGHEAEVEQVGNNNNSIVRQELGAGAGNIARTFQSGDDNYAQQDQVTDANSGNTGNFGIIAQGNVTTGIMFDPIWGDLQMVDNITNGSQSLGSFGGIAFQNQSGHENEADIRQFGDDPSNANYAEQNQSNSGNSAFMVQNLYGSTMGAGNYARQDQSGTNSEAGIGQNGFDHIAYQRQMGDDNIALSTQRGHDNLVNTYQDGDSNRATTAQRGECNQILLVQRGGHSYSVEQNLPGGMPVGMPNGGNVADILQLGPGGDFSADAINCEVPGALTPETPQTPQDFTIDQPCVGC
ncbi:curlin [Mesonia ostreae]|uniref:Curlin n=1 Tax=Mesonia ostreae TaxID=861110 RepID=A0ABU2KEM0_9FLAO|nr:curlin [Mesonia ostreae]MDT0293156.1 curlin [Mesonia ostreae]